MLLFSDGRLGCRVNCSRSGQWAVELDSSRSCWQLQSPGLIPALRRAQLEMVSAERAQGWGAVCTPVLLLLAACPGAFCHQIQSPVLPLAWPVSAALEASACPSSIETSSWSCLWLTPRRSLSPRTLSALDLTPSSSLGKPCPRLAP